MKVAGECKMYTLKILFNSNKNRTKSALYLVPFAIIWAEYKAEMYVLKFVLNIRTVLNCTELGTIWIFGEYWVHHGVPFGV